MKQLAKSLGMDRLINPALYIVPEPADDSLAKFGWTNFIATAPAVQGGCVMVIDDEQSLLVLMKTFLEHYGIRVHGFTDPFDAIAWYERRWKGVDLVFLSMKNPQMDGEFCFAILQSVNSEVRVALMCEGTTQEIANELLEEGALRSFSKPLDFPAVVSWTRHCVIG